MKALLGLTYLGCIIALIYGWVLNIVALIGTDAMNGLAIARAIGVFAAPLGGILGLFV